MVDINVPIYLITGFLESGKTSFINFNVGQEYFQIPGKTLIITTEEGEEEYDLQFLKKNHTVLEVISNQEDFNPTTLKLLSKKHHPERVLLEYNPLWTMKLAEEMKYPRGWGIVQEIVQVDGESFEIYMNNMKSLFMDMIRNADMVRFNRCKPEQPMINYRRSVRVVNPACEIYFEDEDGRPLDILEDTVPYDLDADVVEISDVDYGIFYVDLEDHPERYDGKTVRFKGMVLKSETANADYFVPGRMAMTCCADDTAFIGYICRSAHAKELLMGSWVEVTAKVGYEYVEVYGAEGPVFQAINIKGTKMPEHELVYFN